MTPTFAQFPIPTHTPWGTPDRAIELAPGILLIDTPSHGGIWLSPERNALIPAWIKALTFASGQGRNGWYEEDCDIAIPLAAFPECKDRMPNSAMNNMSRAEWYEMLRKAFAADICAAPGGIRAFEQLTASWAPQEA